MLNLPIQSAPINRTRVTRGSVAAASGGISASQLGIPLVAPFASDDAMLARSHARMPSALRLRSPTGSRSARS